MDPSTPHHYLKAGEEAGVPESALHASAAQIARIQAHGSGPILSLGHLAHLTGAPYLYLREIVQRRRDPYEDIARPKRTGGTRWISAPEPVLMDVHRLILRRALRNLPLHPFSYAYQEGRTIYQCAQQHIGARWMLKFDLHDFFGHVEERDVFRVFEERGYSPLVYTRYSDDMVMSTSHDFDRTQAIPVIRDVTRLVAAHRFRLHRKKTRIVPPGARHIVLGLLVDGDEVRLTPEFRRRVEVHIRGVREFGLVRHADHRGFRSLLSFISHVDGCLAFALSVEPAWADNQRIAWRAALRGHGLRV